MHRLTGTIQIIQLDCSDHWKFAKGSFEFELAGTTGKESHSSSKNSFKVFKRKVVLKWF